MREEVYLLMKAITRDIYIADEIRYKIEIGEFKPHDKLPSERQFCEIFDCQRATVRLALESLLDEGWIYCIERSGYFVSEPRIMETLNVVSSMSGRIETLGRKMHRKVIFLRVKDSNKKLIKKMGVSLGTKLIEFERVRYLDEEAISLETAYFEVEQFLGLLDKDLENHSLFSVLEKDYNVKFTHGEQEILVVNANPTESKYLGVEENSPLVLRRGLLYTDDNQYKSYHESVMRMNRFVYADEES